MDGKVAIGWERAHERRRRPPLAKANAAITAAGVLVLLLVAGTGATAGEARGASAALLALGCMNIADGAATLLPTRSPAAAGMLRIVSLGPAVGVLVFVPGDLLGWW